MKRKVILYMAISLDGYITDKSNGSNWLGGESEFYQGDYGRSGFLSIIDTIIMGAEAYKHLNNKISPNKWPYDDFKTYVMTHHNDEDKENIIFTEEKLPSLIKELQKEDGKNIWVYGGPDIAHQLIKENLIDEYHLTIMPIILGNGKKLFEKSNKEIKLHLVKNTSKNGVIDCLYERI